MNKSILINVEKARERDRELGRKHAEGEMKTRTCGSLVNRDRAVATFNTGSLSEKPAVSRRTLVQQNTNLKDSSHQL